MRFLIVILPLFVLMTACSSVPLKGGDDADLASAENISSRPAVTQLYAQAETELARGNPDAADAALERALRIEPDNGYLWLGLAQIARTQGKLTKARDFARRARSFAGDDASLHSSAQRLLNAL